MSPGTCYAIGVGPGDPDLLTLKAARTIAAAEAVAYITVPEQPSRARATAVQHIPPRCDEIVLTVPMATQRDQAEAAYRAGAERIRRAVAAGQTVALLCEGDPLFYASAGHLLECLAGAVPVTVIPGITAIGAAAAHVGQPLVRQMERLTVVTGRNDDATITAALQDAEAVAILKAGRHRPRLLDLIRASGRWHTSAYVEQAGLAQEQVYTDLDALPAEPGPYFSLFLTLPGDAPCAR